MTFPKIGNIAPAFSLKNQDETCIYLKDFKGKKNLVLLFIRKHRRLVAQPKPVALGCICWSLKIWDTVVLGVSPDAPAKLTEFSFKSRV